MRHSYSDGGRQNSAFVDERNDCTVRAFAIATGLPYENARAVMASLGRQPGKGMSGYHSMMDSLKGDVFNGYKIKPITVFYRTVGAFVKTHPEGRYILSVRNHVLAVIEGEVQDWCRPKPRCRLYGVWGFEALDTRS